MDHPESSLIKVDFLLVSALKEEYQALVSYFGYDPDKPNSLVNEVRCHDFLFYTTSPAGSRGFYRIVIPEPCGEGIQAATQHLTRLCYLWPRYVILTGIAGGNPGRKVNLGDVVISAQVIDYTFVRTGSRANPEYRVYSADSALQKYALELDDFHYEPGFFRKGGKKIPRPKATWTFRARHGDIASGNEIAEGVRFFKTKEARVFKLLCTEMEAAGIAFACQTMNPVEQGIPAPGFLVVRGISDLASDNRRSRWRTTAVKTAAALTFALVQSGKVPFWERNMVVTDYLRSLQEEYQYIRPNITLPVPNDPADAKERAMKLDSVYIGPNIELRIRKGESLQTYYEEMKKYSDQNPERGANFAYIVQQTDLALNPESLRDVSLFEVFPQNPYVIILGKPGSGKTTYVDWLMHCFTQQLLSEKREENPNAPSLGSRVPLPIRLAFRDFLLLAGRKEKYTKEDIWNALQATIGKMIHSVGDQEHIMLILRERGAFLFDGFDEVGDHNIRSAVLQALQEFAKSLSEDSKDSWLLITSRPYAIPPGEQDAFRSNEFQIERIADFNPSQIQHFIDCWYPEMMKYGLVTKQDLPRSIRSLKDEIDLPSIDLLAQNPLFLSLMITIHATRGTLPENRVALYNAVVDLSIDSWNWGIGATLFEVMETPGIRPEHIRHALEEIAFRTHQNHHGAGGPSIIQSETIRAVLLPLLQSLRNREFDDISEPDRPFPSQRFLPERFPRPSTGSSPQRPSEEEVRILDNVLGYLENRAGLLTAIASPDLAHREVGSHSLSGAGSKSLAFTFPHRTFQEYLAACHLVRQEAFISQSTQLALEDPLYWREVLIFAAKQADIDRGLHLVQAIIQHTRMEERRTWGKLDTLNFQRAFVAAEQLLEIGEPIVTPLHQAVMTKVIQALEITIRVPEELMNSKERIRAGRVLGILGDQRREIRVSDEMQFCHIPAGEFAMLIGDIRSMGTIGIPEQDENFQLPYENKMLPDFFIARYPVTISQYHQFLFSEEYTKLEYWKEAGALGVIAQVRSKPDLVDRHPSWMPIELLGWNAPEIIMLPNHPKTFLSWFEALAFTRWLTDRWRAKFGLPAAWNVRLPKESEWEKAARGGYELPEKKEGFLSILEISRRIQEGKVHRRSGVLSPTFYEDVNNIRPHPWGKYMPSGTMVPSAMGSIVPFHTPGCFPIFASPYGAEEMYGCIWEWCQTKYFRHVERKADSGVEAPDRESIAASDAQRTVRGQITYPAFTDTPSCSVRHGCDPKNKLRRHGMRCVIAKAEEAKSSLADGEKEGE